MRGEVRESFGNATWKQKKGKGKKVGKTYDGQARKKRKRPLRMRTSKQIDVTRLKKKRVVWFKKTHSAGEPA